MKMPVKYIEGYFTGCLIEMFREAKSSRTSGKSTSFQIIRSQVPPFLQGLYR